MATINNDQIKEILSELYELDSSLKSHEKHLMKYIKDFIDLNPKAEINKKFKEELRGEIMKKCKQLKEIDKLKKKTQPSVFHKYFLTFLGGAVVAFFMVTSFPQFQIPFIGNNKESISTDESTSVGGETINTYNIIDKGEGAFGVLKGQETSGERGAGPAPTPVAMDSASPERSVTSSAPATQVTPESVAVEEPVAVLDEATLSKQMPFYIPEYRIDYVYSGDLPKTEDMLNVYKRILPGSTSADFLKSENIGLGILDAGNFDKLSLQNLSVAEEKKNGYTLLVSNITGEISIYQNYVMWAQPASYEPVKESEIPADETLIASADKFLKDYGISVENYGKPYVRKYWEEQKLRFPEGEVYYPETIPVIYPEVIEGNTVYDESGFPVGINLDINIKQGNKVSNVYGLSVKNFESSKYEKASDEALKEVIKKGGVYNYYSEEAKDIIEVQLNAPEMILMKTWSYQEGKSEELYVPALVFEVSKFPENKDIYVNSKVVIPLVKDLLTTPNYPILYETKSSR